MVRRSAATCESCALSQSEVVVVVFPSTCWALSTHTLYTRYDAYCCQVRSLLFLRRGRLSKDSLLGHLSFHTILCCSVVTNPCSSTRAPNAPTRHPSLPQQWRQKSQSLEDATLGDLVYDQLSAERKQQSLSLEGTTVEDTVYDKSKTEMWQQSRSLEGAPVGALVYDKSLAGGSGHVRRQPPAGRRRSRSSRRHGCSRRNSMSAVEDPASSSEADDEADRPEFIGVTVVGGKVADPPLSSVAPTDSTERRSGRGVTPETGGWTVNRREPDVGATGVADPGSSDGNDAPWISRRGAGVTATTTTAAAMTVGETGRSVPKATSAEGCVLPSRTCVRDNLVGLGPDSGGQSGNTDINDAPRISPRGAGATTTATTTTAAAAAMMAGETGGSVPRTTSVEGYASPSRTSVRDNLVGLGSDSGSQGGDTDGNDAPWIGRRRAGTTTTTSAAPAACSRRSPEASRGQARRISIRSNSPPPSAAAPATSGLGGDVDGFTRRSLDVECVRNSDRKVSFDFW